MTNNKDSFFWVIFIFHVLLMVCYLVSVVYLFRMLSNVKWQGVEVFELKIPGLEKLFFGSVIQEQERFAYGREENVVEEYCVPFFPSANRCRWVINFDDISLGPQVPLVTTHSARNEFVSHHHRVVHLMQIGTGSFGIVYKGTWKGVEVAVKRFIRQRFDEATMLQFRAETGLMSALQHGNVAMLVGSCVRRPNVCLVSEFVGRGTNLKKILANHSLKLKWKRKLKVLRGVAKGMAYLHSERVLHRNLKPSNVLVEQNWNVKVTDFGFARIKEDHATMTKCEAPSWTGK